MRLQAILVTILICLTTGCRFAGDQPSSIARVRENPAAIPQSSATLNPGSPSDSTSKIKRVSFVRDDSDTRSATTVGRVIVSAVPVELVTGDLETIESMAIAINPAIKKVEAELAALKGKCVQVGLNPNPRAGIIGDDINDSGSAGRYGVFYSQQVVRSNRLGLARKKVCAEIKAKEIQLVALQQRLVTDVRIAYFEMLVASRKLQTIGELVAISNKALEATSKLVEAQEVAETARLQAEVELQKAQLKMERAENELAAGRRRLAGFIDEPEFPFASFTGSLEPNDQVIDIESRFQTLLDGSPELSKMFASVDVARRNLDHQCSLRIPDVTWQTGLAYDFSSDEWVPSFQVGVPIMKHNRNQGAIAQARNEIVAREKEAEQKALQLRQRLVSGYRLYQDARLQVEAIGEGILPTAKRTLELVTLGYEQGEVSYLELLTAQRTYFTINLDYIEQLKVLWRQSILIDGMMLSENLDQFE